MASWQKDLTWEQQFDLLGADGIDFHDILTTLPQGKVIQSFTKEEFLKNITYPRSGYTFWKMINGYKCYLHMTNETTMKAPHKVFIDAGVEYIVGYLRYGHYEGEIEIPDEEWESFKANPKAWIDEHDAIDDLELLVDDWSIEGVGNIDEINWDEV